jgi:spore coat polysaccharide biosynthesis protein SpsF (cytidylyltransferase family)
VRLPNKTFLDIEGKPLIWHIVNRISRSRTPDRIVIATTVNPGDNVLERWARDNGIDVFRGSENDVLSRYYEAAKSVGASTIVRVTADDPFKDPEVLDLVTNAYLAQNVDFAYNI